MKKCIVSLIALCVILVSCEQEKLIFDQSQTYLKFDEPIVDLAILLDSTGTTEAKFNVSNLSSSERTYEFEIDTDKTNADPDSYTLGTFVVPANSYVGSMTITGVDTGNITTEAKRVVLRIPPNSDLIVDGDLTIKVFQSCPVPETAFVGKYTVEFADPDGPDGGTFTGGLAFADDVTYELVVDPNDQASRIMQIIHQPKFASCAAADPIPFKISFICNEIIVSSQDNSCTCGGNTTGGIGPAIVPTTYDLEADNFDSTFVVKFEENANGACTDYAFFEAEVTFTKVQ